MSGNTPEDDYNQRAGIPKVFNLSPITIIQRDNFYVATTDPITDDFNYFLQMYWGPGQLPLFQTVEYLNPNPFAASSQILKIPVIIRFIYEDPEIDVYFDLWAGYSGDYSYGTHSIHFDEDIVSTDSNVYPSHVHSTGPFIYEGFVSYAIEGTITFTGGTGGYTASGSTNFWQVPGQLDPGTPFSWIDYLTVGSYTRGAIEASAAITIGGFIPFGAGLSGVPGALGIIPEYSGLQNNGVGPPIFLTNFAVDGVEYGAPIMFPYPLTIQVGYSPPSPVDVSNHLEAWELLGVKIQADYAPNQTTLTYDQNGNQLVYWPWVDSFELEPTDNGYTDLLVRNPVFFGTAVCQVIVFSAYRDLPSDSLIDAIKATFPFFAGFRVLIFVDIEYMNDCGNNRTFPSTQIFCSELEALCGGLMDYGWVWGGQVGFNTAESDYESIIKPLIDQFIMGPKSRPSIFNPPGLTSVIDDSGEVIPVVVLPIEDDDPDNP